MTGALLAAFVLALPASAASPRVVNDADTVAVEGNVSPRLATAVDVGPTDGALPLEKMILVLRPRAGASDAVERLLAEQVDRSSPNYHRWLTPEEYGREFGPTDADLSAVLAWLQRSGFAIDEVAPGRGWINFSGTVAQVEATFRTEMRDFVADGRLHHANVRDPEVPRALADVVGGIARLHDFPKTPQLRRRPSIAFTDGTQGLGPADFATIYDTTPLLAAGIDGTGQTIAVVAQSNIKLADVRAFRSFFGLPARDPVITVNGADPGIVTDDESEADLDVEWAGGVAPGATVDLVVSASTDTADGVDLSAEYIVDRNLAPIVTYSYGTCESDLGTSGLLFYDDLWRQAAAQGMAVFVAAGDNGAAGCDDPTQVSVGTGPGVNGLASTPNDVCVGGTEFVDGTSALYWSPSSAPVTHLSAKSYVPEETWNESGSVPGGSGIWATGGGPSAVYAKPSWQSAPGVPADGARDTPDVSLAAASTVGYVVFSEYDPGSNLLYTYSGTSASAQGLGGIMALVLQSAGGGRQGNPNPVLYRLAAATYSGSGPAVFHDVTAGNNGVPGVTGFAAGTGYDLATGLGSVDVRALASAYGAASGPTLAVTAAPSSVSFAAGASANVDVTTAGTGGFDAAVSLTVAGLPAGVTATFVPPSVGAPGSGGATLALVAASSAASGTFSAAVTASGGGLTATAPLSVTIVPPSGPAITSFGASPAIVAPGQSSTLSWTTVGATSASIDNGVGPVPTSGSMAVRPAQGTRYTLTVAGPGGAAGATAVVNVSGAFFSVTRLVPIVLNAAGLAGSSFSTELTLANRGTLTAEVQLTYTAASALSGAGSGSVATTLGPGQQLVVPDTIAYLRTQGLSIPSDGSSQGGTLLVTFTGLSSADAAFASARTTTPSGSGRAGLSYAAARVDDVNVPSGVQTGSSWLYGLRENSADRSNLALVNASTSAAITLAVTLFDGTGAASFRLSPDVSLGPGQWTQIGSVLSRAGFAAGYARIDLVSGPGPYFAYAVFNDNVTNDGSFVPPGAGSPPAEAACLPVLVETPVFQSELVLANSSAAPETATLTYVESLAPSLGPGGSATLALAPGEQMIIPAALDFLRLQGVAIGPAGAASYAGSLSVTFRTNGALSSGFAGARVSSAAPGGGEYGVFYPAFGVSASAASEAWVFGLQHTPLTRSNLAVVNMGDTGGNIVFHLEVYDGDTGRLAGTSADTLLGPLVWLQLNDVLAAYGVSNGFARVVVTAGTDRLLAYGVVNDGATPASGGTNDGSFLAFCNR